VKGCQHDALHTLEESMLKPMLSGSGKCRWPNMQFLDQTIVNLLLFLFLCFTDAKEYSFAKLLA
jgi:hypothetical protein